MRLTCCPSTSLLRPGQWPVPHRPGGPGCCCGLARPGTCWSAGCPPPAFFLPPGLAAEPLCRCVPGPKAGKSASVSMLSETGAAGAAAARLATCAASASSVQAAGAPLVPGAPLPGGRKCSSVTVRGSSWSSPGSSPGWRSPWPGLKLAAGPRTDRQAYAPTSLHVTYATWLAPNGKPQNSCNGMTKSSNAANGRCDGSPQRGQGVPRGACLR